MSMISELLGLLSPKAVVTQLGRLPDLDEAQSPVMQTMFSDRPPKASPYVGSNEIEEVAEALPLVPRGGDPVSASKSKGMIVYYAPLPIRVSVDVTGEDIQNWKIWSGNSKELWISQRIDFLRKLIRKTTEGMCARASTGTIEWPIYEEKGSWGTFEMSYGNAGSLAVDAADKWDAASASIKKVYDVLMAMEEIIEDADGGIDLEVWAGKKAFSSLFALAENFKSTAKLPVSLQGKHTIDVAGYSVRRMGHGYKNPRTKDRVPVVPENSIRVVAKDGGHKMPYCALDNLLAGLKSIPFFINVYQSKKTGDIELIAESKPFPIVNVRSIAEAEVVAA